MNLKKIRYCIARLSSLGLRGSLLAIYRHLAKKLFIVRWRRKALGSVVCIPAEAVMTRENEFMLCSATFAQHVLPQISSPFFTNHLPDYFQSHQTLFAKADAIVNGSIELFGQEYPAIDWGNNNFPPSWNKSFYADIPITWTTGKHDPCQPDVKVPWEYARFNALFTLGMAYNAACKSGDAPRAQRYATSFVTLVSNWLDHTTYMIGITWKCPMDCAIRAINLIYGICFFYQEPSIPDTFWQKLFYSLRNHLHYLEHNLEHSDKPNNHLLADLLGLFFLTMFFKPLPLFGKRYAKKLKAFVEQINHQIMPDGTSYEGSTNYHRLDTEMVLHALVLCKAYGLESSQLEATFNAMVRFVEDCTIAPGLLVQIGDNDSGRIVAGFNNARMVRQAHHERNIHYHHELNNPPLILILRQSSELKALLEKKPALSMDEGSKDMNTSTYPYFGLSIIRHSNWHLTFRHPAFAPYQPSGHFHQDALSFTLAYNGIPFIIDPGSFTYTPHGWSRNIYRSVGKHNTLFVLDADYNDTPLYAQDLFQLTMPIHLDPSLRLDDTIIEATSKSYAHKGIILNRIINFDKHNEVITIEDTATRNSKKQHNSPTNIQWLLHFAPGIECEKISENYWLMTDKKTSVQIMLETTFGWNLIPTEVSLSYGAKLPSLALTTRRQCSDNCISTLTLRKKVFNRG